MISCGIDVGLHRQHLCTLDADGRATHHEPGPVADIVAVIRALGPDAVVGIDSPAQGTAGLLAAGAPLRAQLGLEGTAYRTARVSDWQLIRRGLPLYPVPPAGTEPSGWQAWMARGYELFAALDGLGRFAPEPDARCAGRADLADGRVFETYPDAVFCALLGERPPPKRTRAGMAARRAALRGAGVDDDLQARTHDQLDACAAALTARALAAGRASWLGHRAEGVLVVPVAALADRYVSRARRRPSSPG